MKKLLTIKEKLNDNFQGCYQFPNIDKEAVSSTSIITVICPFHGSFYMKLNQLIKHKSGCPRCKDLRRVISMKKGKDFAHMEMINFYKFILDPNTSKMMELGVDKYCFSKYPHLTNDTYDLLKLVYFKYKLISGTNMFSL